MSRAADALRVAGLAELSLAVVYGNYQYALRSPMTLGGSVASPEWMVATHVHLMGLGIILILYSFIIDDVFLGYRNLTAAAAILAMWFEPLVITLLEGLGIGIAGLIGQIAAAVSLIIFFAFLINYLRRGWGTAGE